MKRLIISIGVIILLAGCGQEHGSAVSPAPITPNLLDRGWSAYQSGNYETAEATFDSVITIDADNFEAYLGTGWSAVQLSDFREALRVLSIGLGLTGNSPTIEKDNVPIFAENSWTIKIPNLAGILSNQIVAVVHDTAVYDSSGNNLTQYRNFPGQSVYYDVVYFTDSSITVTWNADKNPSILEFPDDFIHPDLNSYPDTFNVMPLPPESTDDITFDYIEYKGGSGDTSQADIYACRTALYSGNRDYYRSIASAKACLLLDSAYKFEYDSTNVNAQNLHKIIAYSCYNLKFYQNAADEVHNYLDTSWVWDSTKTTALYDLESKIEALLNEK